MGENAHAMEDAMKYPFRNAIGKLALFLSLVLLVQCFTVILADAAGVVEKSIGGTITRIAYAPGQGNAGTITVTTPNAAVANRELWAPDTGSKYYRLIVDIKNTKIDAPGSLTVNSGAVAQIRYAQFDAIRSRIVVDLTAKPVYDVATTATGVEIRLNGGAVASASAPASPAATPKPSASAAATPKPSATPAPTATPTPVASSGATPVPSAAATPSATPKPATTPVSATTTSAAPSSAAKGALSWTLSGSTCVLKLADTDLAAKVAQGGATIENRTREKMVQVTFTTPEARFLTGALPGNAILYGALVSHNASRGTTTIRLSGKTALNYTMEKAGADTLLRLTSTGGATPGTVGGTGSAGASGSAGSGGSGTVIGGTTGTATPVNDSTSRGTARTLPVQVTASGDSVMLDSTDVSGSRVYRSGSGVVIEMPGVALPGDVPVGGALVRTVNTVSADGRVKLSIGLNGLCEWTATESAGRLTVAFQSSGITNIEGGNDADVVLRLLGPGIVSRYRAALEQVVIDDDLQMSAFTFMFPATVINMGNGVAKTNDALSTGISVLTTGQSSFLSIAKRSADTQFKLVEDADGNGLTIKKSVLERPVPVASGTGRLVVLDAGHGGSDPGTVFGGLYESHVNLDITLRAEAILRQRGVNVLLTRNSDVFVGLEERCNIANNAGASLFLSIHQNSMPDGMRGTMSMYYASSVNGKNYAQILQDTLMPALGLGDLGLKSSSGLVVLRKTKMPAILAECACMSNPSDLAVVMTDAFRQKAATAIADSVVKILATMN